MIHKMKKNLELVAVKNGKSYVGQLDAVRTTKDKGLQYIVRMSDGTYRSFYHSTSTITVLPVPCNV